MRRFIRLACAAAGVLGGGGGAAGAVSTGAVTAEAYRIHVDDTLQVFVWQQEEVSGEFVVQSDGRIVLPLIRDVQAAGRTTEELAAELTSRLTQYLKEPKVTVTVKRAGFSDVLLLGQVGRPGPKLFKPGLTLLMLLSESGGFGEDAVMTGVRLVRRTDQPGRVITRKINAKRILYKGDPDVPLQPGDVIYVPTAALASFN